NAADRRQQPRAFGERAAVGPRRTARHRAALRRAAADAGAVSAGPQLGRRDLSGDPAHRLVFGYGIVAWEFQLGMRSWTLPGTIAGLMQLSRVAATDRPTTCR